MKPAQATGIVLLALYSVALVLIELRYPLVGKALFANIEGKIPFYAVNTTLSVFLLWATALTFAACLVCLDPGQEQARERAFCWSQVLVFAFLGADDRFVFHVLLGQQLAINDAWILLVVALCELGLLFRWGNLRTRSRAARIYLLAAGALFGLMTVADAFRPPGSVLAYSLEDLPKTWAGFFLLLFAWELFRGHVGSLKAVHGR